MINQAYESRTKYRDYIPSIIIKQRKLKFPISYGMKVALVHDYLIQYGGAERVLEEFSRMFPDAPIYTLLYNAKRTGHVFDNKDIRTSFLQKIPHATSLYKLFPPLMPIAVESFNLSGYDLILSSSASYAKGALSRAEALNICYCHSPLRYAWLDYRKITGSSIYPNIVNRLIPFFLPYIRIWDKQACNRPDAYMCNSHFIQRKIKKYYDVDAKVVYPPLNFDSFYIAKPKNYFLIVGRMVPYKRFDIAIKAFNQLGLELKIIGAGPEYKKLKKMARANIEFVNLVSESDLYRYYAQAQALIFPQEEDFGITATECMASGRPVIAYRAGGALESVQEGKSGIFFDEQNEASLVEAIKKFQKMNFDPKFIRLSVSKFDRANFHKQVFDFIREQLKNKTG